MKRCPPRIASSETPARSGQRFSRPNGRRAAPRPAAMPRAPTSEWVMPRWVSSAHTPWLQKMSTSGSIPPPAQQAVEERAGAAERAQERGAGARDPGAGGGGAPGRGHLGGPRELEEPVERIRRDLALNAGPGGAAEENVVAPRREALPLH